MFKPKALLVAVFSVVAAANTHAMQQEQENVDPNPRLDIIDNTEYEPLPLAEQQARVAAFEQRQNRLKRHLQLGQANVDTAHKARLVQVIADKNGLSKASHKFAKRAEQLERTEQGLWSNVAATELFPASDLDDSDSDSEQD